MEHQNDMPRVSIIDRLRPVAAVLLPMLVLYVLFLWRASSACKLYADPFITLVTMGACTIFLFHITVNIAMTVGLMPVTGLPLPFLSYGGSFAVTCMVLVGGILCMRYQGGRQ